MIFIRLIFLLSLLACAHAQTLTQAEYFFNTDPGQGAGTPIAITAGENITLSNLAIPVSGLARDKVHRFYIRVRGSEGNWGIAEGRYFIILSPQTGTTTHHNVTQAEYWFDNLPPATIDVTDAPGSSYAAFIPAEFLQDDKVHTFWTRFKDDRNIWSATQARHFVIVSPQPAQVEIHFITHVEYWVDSLAHTMLDITDGTDVDFIERIPHSLQSGAHKFYLRFRDDRLLWSATEGRNFVLVAGLPPPESPSRLAAAEYFIGADPGQGNGVAISLPQDGTWDERNEDAAVVVTGLPRGLHLFGLRFQDDQGIWSLAMHDTVLVTPILVIKPSGNHIVLYWQADSTHIPFHVFRGDSPTATFTEIAQTDSMRYTDSNIIATDLKKFYYITTTTSSFSSFRLPARLESIE